MAMRLPCISMAPTLCREWSARQPATPDHLRLSLSPRASLSCFLRCQPEEHLITLEVSCASDTAVLMVPIMHLSHYLLGNLLICPSMLPK